MPDERPKPLRQVNRDTLAERYATAEWNVVDCADGILRPFTDSPTPLNYGLIVVVPKSTREAAEAERDEANAESSRYEDDRLEARERAEAAEAEVERLRRAALNDTYLDEGVELVLNDLRKTKAENGRLREALTAVAGYKHAPLIESLDDARRVAAAALSPTEDA